LQSDETLSVFEMVGGEATFRALVDAFYSHVEADPTLRPMFPDDLEPGKRYQMLFLIQYWGGPNWYIQERGHPRMRLRHAPYPITAEARDQWVNHMLAAIDEVGIVDPARSLMREYFQRTATFLVNTYVPSAREDGL